jgi:AraC-like DNA-binding protein
MQNQPLPVIYISDKRTIYLGRSRLPLRDIHSGNAWLLACLEGHIRFRTNSQQDWVSARTLLIPAGSKINIDNKHAVLSVCYLDASRPDFVALKGMMDSITYGIYHGHRQEPAVIGELLQIRDEELDFDQAQQRMENIIYAPYCEAPYSNKAASLQTDPRIAHVINRLRETSAQNLSVKELAKEVGMSESGLIKLFRKHIGAPIRKHRLWYRLNHFITLVMAGKAIPQATRLAGFSDASHLSKCYSSLMGVPVSVAFSRAMSIRCVLSEDALIQAENLHPQSYRLALDAELWKKQA